MHHSTPGKGLAFEVRRTLELAFPVMVGLAATMSMNFVDTVMAGRLPEGDVALAALATGGALWSAMLLLSIGLLMAVQPSVAQLDGAGEPAAAGAVTRQGAWIALGVGGPYFLVIYNGALALRWLGVDDTIVPVADLYLRAMAWGAPMFCLMLLLRFFSEGSGHTRPTMYIGVLGALLNVPFNWALMFGHLGFPALGVRGCGYATSAVMTLQALALFLYVRAHSHYRPFRLLVEWERPNPAELRRLLMVGLPIAGTLFVEGSLFVAAALLIGRLGATPAASHLVAINYSALVFMIPLGLGSAATTRVGNALGRGDPAGARHAGLVGLGLVLCTQTASAGVMLAVPEAIASIYTDDAVITAAAAGLLLYAAMFQLPDGIQICSAAILRGYKDTLVPMLINVLSYWAVGLTLGYYLTFEKALGPAGMWIGMIAGLSIGATLMTARFLRLSGRISASRPAPAP